MSMPEPHAAVGMSKCPTGIQGLDEVTGGGLPAGRTTLVCGSAGSGKTLLALSFLVNGARTFGEPGVLVTFDQAPAEIAADVASLGYDLDALVAAGTLAIDDVRIEPSEIEETGEYDLEGLFVRLGDAIQSVGARRVVLDAPEGLFGGLSNEGILRAELRRLFRWLKDRRVTTVITGERGRETLTRYGLEEYVTDAVILLDHRVHDQVSTRRLRVVKYRGALHGTNEYPFIIDADGFTVMPMTSLTLAHRVLDDRVSTGVPEIDAMIEGRGFYRGSTMLASGTAGAGKTSLAGHFADATCRRGEHCVYLLFEESPDQLVRNMRSIGIDLGHWLARGLLEIHAARPSRYGLEQHLAHVFRLVHTARPSAVVLDPVTNLLTVGTVGDVRDMLIRVIDALKTLGITALFTALTGAGRPAEESDTAVSSLMDTWIALDLRQTGSTRVRELSILKSRGMAHSHQVRRFRLTDAGVRLDAGATAAAAEARAGGAVR